MLARIYRDTGRTKQAEQEADDVNEWLTKLGNDVLCRRQVPTTARPGIAFFVFPADRSASAARSGSRSAVRLRHMGIACQGVPHRDRVPLQPGKRVRHSGSAKNVVGSQELAESALREAETRLLNLQKERPDDVRFRSTLADVLTNLGVILNSMERLDEAAEVNQRAVSLFEDRADSLDITYYQSGRFAALSNLASTECVRGRDLQGEQHLRAALAGARGWPINTRILWKTKAVTGQPRGGWLGYCRNSGSMTKSPRFSNGPLFEQRRPLIAIPCNVHSWLTSFRVP